MASDLTEDDLATYFVDFPHRQSSEQVTAAYTQVDGPYVVFKDHEHRIVAMARSDTVSFIRRADPGRSI